MATLAQDRPKVPQPPRIGIILASLLELGIVATLIAHRSILGVVLCVSYAWFSATLALFHHRAE